MREANGPLPSVRIAHDEVPAARADAGAGPPFGGISCAEERGSEVGGPADRGRGGVSVGMELDADGGAGGVDAGTLVFTGASPWTRCAGDGGAGEQFLRAESAAAALGSGLGHVPAVPPRGMAV